LLVGDNMEQLNRAKQTIQQTGGVASIADFYANGLARDTVADFYKAGILHRVRRGYYCLAEPESGAVLDEQILAALFPEAVVCVHSALFHYGYSDRTPLAWSLAFPRTVSRSRLKLEYPPIQPYFVQESTFALGKRKGDFNGVALAVYDRERTICDCFKYREKMDAEIFNKAVHGYTDDSAKNLGNLIEYAKEMRVYRKMADVMGVMLNG